MHYLLLYEEKSREEVSGSPLAYISSGASPWPLENSSWVSSNESTISGAGRGAVVHSLSQSAAERTLWLYLGSYETFVRLLRRVSSVVGRVLTNPTERSQLVGLRYRPPGWILVTQDSLPRFGVVCPYQPQLYLGRAPYGVHLHSLLSYGLQRAPIGMPRCGG